MIPANNAVALFVEKRFAVPAGLIIMAIIECDNDYNT